MVCQKDKVRHVRLVVLEPSSRMHTLRMHQCRYNESNYAVIVIMHKHVMHVITVSVAR